MVCLTLNDGQEDYNDKKEEGNVKNDAIYLILVTSWILNLVTNPATCSHTYIHVKHVALGDKTIGTQEEVEGKKDKKISHCGFENGDQL